ncbi:MAG: hypothetical protein Kow0099_22270 [Candidatus Abyssubacteria bacterium]
MPGVLGNKRGFTLTELLVVVAIIVLLTSIVVPNVASRLTIARMHAAETQIEELKTALANYHADFGTYPGDVFPTEDLNNNGILDTGEDIGVDIDGDGTEDYALPTGTPAVGNGRIDRGDGVVNIDDLEWALKTTAKNGPYMESIPLDPWGNRYVYYAPLDRPTDPNDFLYIDPTTLRSEDGLVGTTANGRLDGDTQPRNDIPLDESATAHEDRGIGQYATTKTPPDVDASFVGKWAGRDNGILDHGDDINKNGSIETYYINPGGSYPSGGPTQNLKIELGNADVSPDGLARNLGFYIYSVGRNGRDESATGYEDIGSGSGAGSPDNFLNKDYSPDPLGDMQLPVYTPEGGTLSWFSEDLDNDSTLDTGYEDTGIDGIPGTKDKGEDDGQMTVTDPDPTKPDEEFGTISPGPTKWHYNRQHTTGDLTGEGFDIGGDDINSWNKKAPWREHTSYGG